MTAKKVQKQTDKEKELARIRLLMEGMRGMTFPLWVAIEAEAKPQAPVDKD